MLTDLQIKFAHWDCGKQGSSWKLLSIHTEQSTQKISCGTAIGVPRSVKSCPDWKKYIGTYSVLTHLETPKGFLNS